MHPIIYVQNPKRVLSVDLPIVVENFLAYCESNDLTIQSNQDIETERYIRKVIIQRWQTTSLGKESPELEVSMVR